jgi:hypothetical protein
MPANIDKLLRDVERAEGDVETAKAELRDAHVALAERLQALVDAVGMAEAARLLGLPSRQALWNRLRRQDLR